MGTSGDGRRTSDQAEAILSRLTSAWDTFSRGRRVRSYQGYARLGSSSTSKDSVSTEGRRIGDRNTVPTAVA